MVRQLRRIPGSESFREEIKRVAFFRIILMFAVVASLSMEGWISSGQAKLHKSCAVEGLVVSQGDWTTIRLPEWPADLDHSIGGGVPTTASSFAVHPRDPKRMVVSNQFSIFQTRDRGCSWEEIFYVDPIPSPEFPFFANLARVHSIHIGGAKGKDSVIHAVVSEYGGVGRTFVLTSNNGGANWETTFTSPPGFRAVGHQALAISASNSDVAYLSLRSLWLSTLTRLYASEDGGRTWELRFDSSAPSSSGSTSARPVSLAPDPLDVSTMWAWEGSDLYLSVDGGRTWDPSGSFPSVESGRIASTDILHAPGERANVAVAANNGLYVSSDDGQNWSMIPIPSPSRSLARGKGVKSFVGVFQTQGGTPTVQRFHSPTGTWLDVTPQRTDEIGYFSSTHTKKPQFLWPQREAILAYSPYAR